MNVYFIVDEYTDVEAPPRVSEMVEVMIDALRNPDKPRPKGEVILGEVIKQYVCYPIKFYIVLIELIRFWSRGRRTVPHETGEPFVTYFTYYLQSVGAEAEARDRDGVLTSDAYLAIRLDNIGVPSMCVLGGLFLSLPDDLYDDPLLAEITRLGSKLVTIDNVSLGIEYLVLQTMANLS